ncbi:hypothetical protein MTO96_048878 [Rhipicephalus appendiculatus]
MLIASMTLASRTLTSIRKCTDPVRVKARDNRQRYHHGEQRHGTVDVNVGHDTSQVALPTSREDNSRRDENLDARRPGHGHCDYQGHDGGHSLAPRGAYERDGYDVGVRYGVGVQDNKEGEVGEQICDHGDGGADGYSDGDVPPRPIDFFGDAVDGIPGQGKQYV